MMKSEFIDLAGFEPTADEYAKIEEEYYNFDGDKVSFCKHFLENGGMARCMKWRAVEIEKLQGKILEVEKESKREETRLQAEIDRLRAELDKEQGWRPYGDAGTQMTQTDYERLEQDCDGQHGDPHVMSEDEAKKLVSDEFGFSAERIEIITTVHTYEVNNHGQLRKAAAFTRQPLYDATDYNYVRFNVRCAGSTWMYEMVNGELKEYSC